MYCRNEYANNVTAGWTQAEMYKKIIITTVTSPGGVSVLSEKVGSDLTGRGVGGG